MAGCATVQPDTWPDCAILAQATAELKGQAERSIKEQEESLD
jgi:hypothetical protein